jgi:hypothetical protein
MLKHILQSAEEVFAGAAAASHCIQAVKWPEHDSPNALLRVR